MTPCGIILHITAYEMSVLLSLLSLLVLLSGIGAVPVAQSDTCKPLDVFLITSSTQPPDATPPPPPLYILYDMNPVEGFNLRRDVYIRMAVFIKSLKATYPNVRLVLPPFSELFHWRSRDVDQKHIFWNQFFDLDSLKLYTDVIDMWEFWEEVRPYLRQQPPENSVLIDEVYRLKHYKDMFANGVFVDKFERTKCSKSEQTAGNYFGYHNLTAKKVSCVNFQGAANLLTDLLKKFEPKKPGLRIVLFLNAEIVLHDHWGNGEFWKCRRSMRFNRRLIDKANEFRFENFNSTDELDDVVQPPRWTDEVEGVRRLKGGDYICAHLRRGDFVYGREKTTPTLRSASSQIKKLAKTLGLDQVFLSSDCSRAELMDLLSFMKRLRVYKYIPHAEEGEKLKDGEVAIIDQIICSKARFFYGTYESTFTYRIYEEREIFGFPTQTTFNTFCKNENLSDCERNSIWPIVY